MQLSHAERSQKHTHLPLKMVHSMCVENFFFLDTLNISESLIRGALKKVSSSGILLPDLRGKKEPPNKVKPTTDKFIREHILLFPRMESHYARKKSENQCLDSALNATIIMHNLYKEKCIEDNITPVSFEKYRRIFCEYKLRFHKHKKD